MRETDYIILRKTPFRESSLIVSGISPEFGRLDFILRRPSSRGASKFQVAGLFRELHIEFKTKKEDLHGLLSAGKFELLTDFDPIAENIPGYFAACALCGVLLANSKPMLPMPETYRAMRLFLQSLCGGAGPEPYESLVYLVLLREAGELPAQEGRAGAFLERILSSAAAGESLPQDIPASYWEKLSDWRKIVCRKWNRKAE